MVLLSFGFALPQARPKTLWVTRMHDGFLTQMRTPLAGLFNSPLGLFDLYHRLALIRSAIQTSVMRQFEFMALWTDGHARGSDAQFLGTPLVASFPRMFMFWIWHGNSFSLR